MKLFYSPNSPFARKPRVLIIEKRLQDQVELVQVDPHSQPANLIAINPLSKVPALITQEGGALCDSPLICEYLDYLPSDAQPFFPDEDETYFEVLALAALSDGIMDAAVEIFMQRKRGVDKQWNDLIEKRLQAIKRAIDTVSRHALPGDGILNMGTATLACALAYVHFRIPDLQWEHEYPELDKWLAHVLKRPAFEQTQPIP